MIRDSTDRIHRPSARPEAGETAGLDQPQAAAVESDALARVLDLEAGARGDVTPGGARIVVDGTVRVGGATDVARRTAIRVDRLDE